ncbi:MAG: phosphoribosylformylglycinamidine cyclo-ligase [Actinobacteria bacterium]|nr:phosphoribosylformylglycinamidine cyclo-ligase [Actinomycetota bacterium]
MKEKVTYKIAGVDIEAGNRAVELIKNVVRSTFRPEVLTDIGGFSGLFSLDKNKYTNPVLVSSTDGVGTKLKIAQMINKHNTIGIDLVAMCANDIIVQGAEPLFLLDYLAVGKLVPETVAAIVEGIAAGCRKAGCALLGGETAEMPGFYSEDEYDLAGFVVGVVEKDKIIDGSKIEEGDKILGIASSGLHSNGYSMVRKVLLEDAGINLMDVPLQFETTLSDIVLTPTKIYVRSILDLINNCNVKGLAHITGGGITQNLSRILPDGLDAFVETKLWTIPRIFNLIQELGNVETSEMFTAFNMGIGMIAVVSQSETEKAKQLLEASGEKVYLIGEIRSGEGAVKYDW